ncbi:uncharacterized protein LOC142177372 [Nicotiana tabacum]|uniref:Uncharacterized protein LOC142177372 n=1 Tax=Nicotiana tabacum TaxID=4097 RepID=A0AC58TXK4_TOBAC
MADDEISNLHHNHPLFLKDSDAPGTALISLKLTGPENYTLWNRSMRVALLVKNKLGFVDGTYVKSSYRGDLATQWERCNAVVVSWLSSTVSAKLVPSIMYASSARKDLWDELDILAPLPSCDCEESRPYVEHLVRQRLLQFLMGLNESYSHVRSDVLLKRPVLSVNQAYAVVVQEESQRRLGVVDSNKDPLTMLAAGKGQMFKNKRPGMICEHCGYRGHLKKNCYKIIGYPPDFKSKRKGQYNAIKLFANTANTGENVIGKNQTQIQQGSYFTEEQFNQLMKLLSKTSTGENSSIRGVSSNLAGTVSLLSNVQCYEWIVDSGASHHITFCKNVLENIQSINRQSNDGVQTPT